MAEGEDCLEMREWDKRLFGDEGMGTDEIVWGREGGD